VRALAFVSFDYPTKRRQAQQAPTPIGCLIVKEQLLHACFSSNEGAHYTERKQSVKRFMKDFLQEAIFTVPTSSCAISEYIINRIVTLCSPRQLSHIVRRYSYRVLQINEGGTQMKRFLILTASLSMLATSSICMAHTETIVGAAIGGATGAAIGQSIGGSRDGVIIWTAIGSMAGAAIGRDMAEREVVVVREEPTYVRHIVRERPAYQRVYYVEEHEHWRHHKHHRHHHDDDD
jgi:hypothetical protein